MQISAPCVTRVFISTSIHLMVSVNATLGVDGSPQSWRKTQKIRGYASVEANSSLLKASARPVARLSLDVKAVSESVTWTTCYHLGSAPSSIQQSQTPRKAFMNARDAKERTTSSTMSLTSACSATQGSTVASIAVATKTIVRNVRPNTSLRRTTRATIASCTLKAVSSVTTESANSASRAGPSIPLKTESAGMFPSGSSEHCLIEK